MKLITVIKSETCYKIRLSREQVEKLRAEIGGCDLMPISYAGAVLLSQGGGWFHIVPERKNFDFAADAELMKGMVRKIRATLTPKDAEVEVGKSEAVLSAPYVGVRDFGGFKPGELKLFAAGSDGKSKAHDSINAQPELQPKKEESDKTPAPEARLQALASRINNRFHRR